MIATYEHTTTGTATPDVSDISEAVVAPWVRGIYAFNSKENPPVCCFQENQPKPADVERSICAVVDISGSMDRHRREVQTVLASLIKDSNADGKVQIPMPSGQTGLVAAVSTLAPNLGDSDVIVVTDGLENQQDSPITVIQPDGGEVCYPFEGHKKSDDYLACVANFVTDACQNQLYVVGIGADAERAAGAFLRRRNCHVALVHRGATHADIVGTVRALRDRGHEQERLPIADRTPQATVSFALSPEAAEYVARMNEAELQAVVSSGEAITISTTPAPPQLSPADIEHKLEAGEAAIRHNWTRGYDAPSTRAYALLALLSMVDHGVPLVVFTAKRWGMFTSGPEGGEMGKRLNQLFSGLVRVGLVQKLKDTPKEGGEYDGNKVPGQSAVYRCLAPATALTTVMANAAFAADQNSIVKRPARGSPSSCAESGGKRKRSGGSP